MDQFLLSKEGLKFSKHLLRKQVYEFVCKLSKFEIVSKDDHRISSVTGAKWIDSEIETFKGYFQTFSIKESKKPIVQVDSDPSTGFFKSALSFIGSFFMGGNNSSTTISTKNAQTDNPPHLNTSKPPQLKTSQQNDVDHLTKVVIDCFSRAGKTSFFNCALKDKTVFDNRTTYVPIVLDFGIKNVKFGETTRVVLQLWDKNGPNTIYQSLVYRGTSIVLLLVDPYSDCYTLDSHSEKVEMIQQNVPNAEVIVITTKKDLSNDIVKKRSISTEEVELFAYNHFGGLYFDITNTELDEPKTIALYCALMKYLTFNE